MKILVILLSILFSNEFHDFRFGRFELRPESESITLFIRLDRANALEAIKPLCENYNLLDQCFTEYVKGHFALAFNDVEVDIKHREHIFNDDFVELYFDIAFSPNQVKKINVYNDVFIELYGDQENIVTSTLHEMRRSFRMNKDRIRTTITY